jgi:adenylylsulfate kinase
MSILLQMTGLSGAGKSTIAQATQKRLKELGYATEIIDGDAYRKTLCKDLGFSKADRLENIRRLGQVGLDTIAKGTIAILAVINPYQAAREELKQKSPFVKTIFVNCPLSIVTERDTKGLYRRALLPKEDPNYIGHFTGISDPFEPPQNADLVLHSGEQTIEESMQTLVSFILSHIKQG